MQKAVHVECIQLDKLTFSHVNPVTTVGFHALWMRERIVFTPKCVQNKDLCHWRFVTLKQTFY